MDVTSGNDILLDCSTVAFPLPKITWTKDNEVVFPNNSNIIFENNDQILRITKADVSNKGHYKCNAKNPAGEVSNEFEVNISGKFFYYHLICTDYKETEILYVNIRIIYIFFLCFQPQYFNVSLIHLIFVNA